ncbi:hypothetical protein N0V86_004365 [Didymella sp. IMI 355093]|nr:hypothetical protein N0V86_004365 [Didymella sp. IMI 355093]
MSTERTRVLVTGGCGFLGSEIVSALLATQRYDITALDINPPALGTATFIQDVRYVRANVLDREALAKVFDEAKPAMVVHTVDSRRKPRPLRHNPSRTFATCSLRSAPSSAQATQP